MGWVGGGLHEHRRRRKMCSAPWTQYGLCGQAVAASSVDGRWPERVVRATECRDAIPLTVPRSVPVPVRVCVRSHGIESYSGAVPSPPAGGPAYLYDTGQ